MLYVFVFTCKYVHWLRALHFTTVCDEGDVAIRRVVVRACKCVSGRV